MDAEKLLKKTKKIREEDIRYPISKIKLYDSYVMVYLDYEKIQVSDDAYFEFGLKDLKGLDEGLYQKLKEEEVVLKAYRGALRKISMKDQSIRQIREYLLKREIKKSDSERIISRLISYGLLNDEKYCISRINYLKQTSASDRQIREKLMKAGISDELIAKHLKSDPEEQYQKALKAAEKYDRNIRNRSAASKKQAILSRLVAAGFPYEICSEAVQSLSVENENELELLQREYLKAKKRFEKRFEGFDLKQHISSYLLNRGFRYEDIRNMTEEENGETG